MSDKRKELLEQQKAKAAKEVSERLKVLQAESKKLKKLADARIPAKVKEELFKTAEAKPPELDDTREVLFQGSGGGASEAGWHSIESFLKCPKEYQFRHVRGVRQPQYQLPDHFAIGSLFHAGRARWFTLKFATDAKAWDSIKDAVQHEAEIQRLPVSMKAEQYTLKVLTLYCEYWSKRAKPRPIAAEYKLGPAPMRPDDPFFLYRTARLDDASEYPEAAGKLCLGESKTTSAGISDCVNQYTLHGQPLLQLVLWKMAPQGEAMHGPVAGIMLDVTKKPYDKDGAKFGRTFMPISDWALTWFVDSLRGYLRAAAQVDWDSEVPRNPQMCTRMEGRARVPCEFRELCAHGRSASLKYVLRDGSSLTSHKPRDGARRMPWE